MTLPALSARMHRLVFGHEIGAEMSRFLRNLSWSVVGGIAGSGAVFLASIAAGRGLGPATYGDAALVVFLGQLYLLVGAGGFDTAGMRSVPRTTDQALRARLTSAAVGLGLLTLIMTSLLVVALREPLGELFGVSSALFVLVVAYGAMAGVRNLLERLLAAWEQFRFQALWRPVEGAVILGGVIGAIWFLEHRTRLAYLVPLIAGGAIISVAYATRLRPLMVHRGDKSGRPVRTLSSYAGIAVLHALAPAGVLYADKVLIHAELGSSSLGLYAAYHAASYLVVAQILAITANVLLPAVASVPDPTPIVAKLRRLRTLTLLPGALLLAGGISIVILGYGDAYELDLRLVVAFAIWGTLLLHNGLLTAVTVTFSRRTYLYTALNQAFRSVLFVAMMAGAAYAGALSLPLVGLFLVVIELVETVALELIVRRWIERHPPVASATG